MNEPSASPFGTTESIRALDQTGLDKHKRLKRFHTQRIPPLRLLGLSLFLVFAWIHNHVLLQDPSLTGALQWVSAGALLYVVLSWPLLVAFYDRARRVNLGDVLLAVDVLWGLAMIYATGAEHSLLFVYACVRAADQTATSARRARFFAVFSFVGFLLMLVGLHLFARPVDWPVAWVKLGLVAGINLYLTGVAGAADRQRRRTEEAIDMVRRLMDDLEQEKIRAQDADEAKSRFLANMSHEIRTPMNAVIGVNRLLLRLDLPEEAQRYARIVDSAAENLLHLINGILDLSKIEAGKLEVERTPFSLRRLLEQIISLHASLAEEKQLDLKIRGLKNAPDWVDGDPTRLRQVLINLLGNAVKFTSEGAVQLTIEALEDDRVRFTVTDTGIGIPPDIQETLFDPFAQADPSTSRKYGGTGLGLAISRRLVDAMDGTLTLESRVDHGSSFSFTLELPPAGPQETQRTGSVPVEVLISAKNARILVADDNEINRMLTEAELQALGFEVRTVCDGYEALDALAEGEYHLLFLDCQMPGIDGYETARRIRAGETESRIPIIALTAQAMKGDRERCLAAGMDDYIMKPFRRSDLTEILSCYLVGFEVDGESTASSSRPAAAHSHHP